MYTLYTCRPTIVQPIAIVAGAREEKGATGAVVTLA
jgi:hypothetical protein